jgi:hypothetical protein
MTEEKMNEMALYYEKEENTLHPGIVYAVIMLDELVHQVQPDGSISWCRDASCPCRDQDQDEDPEDGIEERLVRQAAQHLESRGYFDLWGEHSDLDEMLSRSTWML